MAVKSYRDLVVWQKAMDLVIAAHGMSDRLPPEERYGLANQLRRAAASIPANIAEGHARTHRKEYRHHLSIARGSLAELETHLAIAVRLDMINREHAMGCWDLSQEVGRMLTKVIQSLRDGNEA